ncbi:hypothetical protein BGZ49_009597 [Haplosporangium sp. Z 27]|nr:hypothetical protein BGZ49_009597 [Haplosporangium sp. Z 27]
MATLVDPSTQSSSWSAYTSLDRGHNQGQEHRSEPSSIPLKSRSYNNPNLHTNDSELEMDGHDNNDIRIDVSSQGDNNEQAEDDGNDDNEDDLDYLDDLALLTNSKRYRQVKTNSGSTHPPRSSRPCKIFGTFFGTATIVALAFALLSSLHLNNVTHNQSDSRVLKPPEGLSVDDFKLSDFQLPPWDWDINSYRPINITNGPKFTHIQWRNGEQFLQVSCPQPNYQYYFPSFQNDEFKTYPSTVDQGSVTENLLHLGDEPYVFVLCPPGINNANLVFREFDTEGEEVPDAPPYVKGTAESPQPLLDDVVMILIDAISRTKFTIEMKKIMETLANINSTAEQGHRIIDFEHYNTLGQNSPPNKAYIYSGQSFENMKHGPKHWIWDVYEEQGFRTAHTDGECGGERGVHDYTSGAITFEYSRLQNRIPAQYQMPQTVWCKNHEMHFVSIIWGRSCTLPNRVDYMKALMGGMRWDTPYCAGEKAIHEHIMENLEGWLSSTKGKRRFTTYTFLDAHSPDHNHISFDKRFAEFVQSLLVGQDGRPPLLSPKSALIIMSDHGLHYGRETYTLPGFIHHKLPPLFIALPNQLLNTHPEFVEALEQNRKKIVSHLDLHQTFIHLAYGDMPIPPNGGSYAEYMTKFIADGTFRRQFHAGAPNGTSYAQYYGRSLLLPIENNRTCSTAGIPHSFCAFQPFLDLDPGKSVDATFLRGVLVLITNHLNNMTRTYGVDDICKTFSAILEPNVNVPSPTSSFGDIGTEDLVMESAHASAGASHMPQEQGYGGQVRRDERIFYFIVRDRHQPTRKFSIIIREDELVKSNSDDLTIIQISAYARAWSICSKRIADGGRAVGDWSEVKHICIC